MPLTELPGRKGTVFAALCAYVVWTILNHEVVQNWLGPIADSIGRARFYGLAAMTCAGTGLALTTVLWRRTASHPAGRELRTAWAFTILACGVAAYVLTVNNSELAHFLQYAIFGAATAFLCRQVSETVAFAAMVGLADEGFQYFVLHPTWGIPWDFNDVTLNLLGAALGAILWTAMDPKRVSQNSTWWRRPGMVLLGLLLLSGIGALSIGKVTLYENPGQKGVWFAMSRLRVAEFWFHDASWGPRTIHILTPIEGPLLLILIVGAYVWLDLARERAA